MPPFPAMEVAGLATNVLSSIFQAKEARKRFRAMKAAAKRLTIDKDRNFNTALTGLRGAQASWEGDAGRATLRDMWMKRLANPDVIDAGQLSTMKAQGYDSATREAGGSVSRVREQAQRVGLGGSRAGLGAEAAMRGQAFSRNASISNDLDLNAAKANTASRDSLRGGYASYLSNENDTRSGFAQQIANLYGSQQYGESDLLARMS